MGSLITVNDGSGTSTSPALVLGYDTQRASQNIVHDIIGGGIAVSLIRPRPRAGTLELFYLTEAAAFAALDLHSIESTFSLADSDRPAVNMTYALDGSGVQVALDPETRNRWIVSVSYQEVEL